MKTPIISWYIKDNDDYIQDDEFYYGSVNPGLGVSLTIQVWNNRYGQSEVQSISNARLAIYFENAEDSILLNYCTVRINEEIVSGIQKELNRLTVPLGTLSGEANSGLDNSNNKLNFKNVDIIFSDLPQNLKSGLKSMYLDIDVD